MTPFYQSPSLTSYLEEDSLDAILLVVRSLHEGDERSFTIVLTHLCRPCRGHFTANTTPRFNSIISWLCRSRGTQNLSTV